MSGLEYCREAASFNKLLSSFPDMYHKIGLNVKKI
jgi:hypothetical protein